ncbi:MAG: SpvB/TcaC N-terminal domain-containing protein, partial [Bacteroidota bacterium]
RERIFAWKLERTYDDRGNVIEYDYKREDGHGTEGLIYEKNRTAYAQHYLKSVRYGNTVPYQPLRDGFDLAAYEADNKWLFEVVFDYGEHEDREDGVPAYSPTRPWSLRQDPYSTYRAGFEVRTYRLCRRILMYHHMPEELGVENYLVKATVLTHQEDAVVSQLTSVQHTGYQLSASLGAYTSKSYPAVTFGYTKVKVDHTVHTVTDDQLPNLPQGIDSQQYQFVDLYQEGLSGVLAQRTGGWYYKENLGGGEFGAQRLVAFLPSPALAGSLQLADYDGNGRLDAVVQNGTLNGYYELDEADEWGNYRPFVQPLSFPLNDTNARQLDLNGDGIADVFLTEDDCFVYHASAGKEGYKAARRIGKML